MNSLRCPLILSLSLLAVLSRADVAYSNLANYNDKTWWTNFPAQKVGSDTATQLEADDLHYSAQMVGRQVSSVTVSVINQNTTAVTAGVHLVFYEPIAGGYNAGALLGTYDLGAMTFAAGNNTPDVVVPSATNVTFAAGGALFALPARWLWAGIVFDDENGTTGATADQLGNLGMGFFDLPTVGSSVDYFFWADNAGVPTTNAPAGFVYDFKGYPGNPKANFGWKVEVQPVPEPTSMAVLGLGAFGVLKRRKKA